MAITRSETGGQLIYVNAGTGRYQVRACLAVVGDDDVGWIFFNVESNMGPIPMALTPVYYCDDTGCSRAEMIVAALGRLRDFFSE